jgi:asparagine N-glycosylation enzyme membrane subunit Stt3
MISLLIWVLIVLLIFGAIFYAVRTIPIDQPFKNIAYIIILVLFIIVLLGLLGLVPGFPGRTALP